MANKRGRSNRTISRENNSNTYAVLRAQQAQRTAQGIKLGRRTARDAALQNVYLEIDALSALPPHKEEFVVERLVPSRVQPLAQSKIPEFLRRKGVLRLDDRPTTLYEYAFGESKEVGTDQQRLRVAELLRGWRLPDIFGGGVPREERPKIVREPNPHAPHEMRDISEDGRALVVVVDYRAWGGHVRPHDPSPRDERSPNILGVVDNEFARWGDCAIAGMTEVFEFDSAETIQTKIDKLNEIGYGLATIRRDATIIPPTTEFTRPILTPGN